MTKEQKSELKQILTDESDFWTCGQIRTLIQKRFNNCGIPLTYSKRQVQRLLRAMGMCCYKPQPRDYRQSPQHKEQLSQRLQAVADVLGMGTKNLEKVAIGFGDESSFQSFSNSARMWSFHKGKIRKVNTTKTKQNCFGFYAIRGKSLLVPIKRDNEVTFSAMLDKIKEQHLDSVLETNSVILLRNTVMYAIRSIASEDSSAPAARPDSTQLELSEMVVDSLQGWIFAYHISPLRTRVINPKNGIHDCTQRMVALSFFINYFFDKLPTGVRHFREIPFHELV